MDVDAFFAGPIVAGTPELRDQALRKMPGHGDADQRGDYCNN